MASGASPEAERGRRPADGERFQKRLTWICLGFVLAGPVLGFAAALPGAAEVYPSEYMLPVALGVMLGLIGLGLLIAACAGLYVMAGWGATPFGAVLVAGIGVLGYGIAGGGDGWRDAGTALLAVSCAAFWAAPSFSPRAKAKSRGRSGSGSLKGAGIGGVLGAGALIAAAGHVAGVWWLLLFGALAVGSAVGAGIAVRRAGRRSPGRG
ncbi:hypothetical protein [Nocardiopsis potens]|uniref:hypothetical protein n=1 Tax=Nocardiopsis potens TaxID=1246458 RepID=UPI0003451556|nr:hypothetical protein [Nocardiopsis potens]